MEITAKRYILNVSVFVKLLFLIKCSSICFVFQCFSNIYDWAGEYRTVDIFKGEAVLGGISLNYTTYSRIPYEINDKIN